MGTISSGPAALAIDLMAVPPAMTDHDTKGCRGRIYREGARRPSPHCACYRSRQQPSRDDHSPKTQ
jgi:hypothetical protein